MRRGSAKLSVSLPIVVALATAAMPAQTSAQAPASARYEVTIERGVTAKMRDGVILRADIYRPKADGKFPVLLERTPYDKNGGHDLAMRAVARGYIVVIQDVRGRYTSDGDFYTFKNEANDGYDTVEWVAALPYANGKVGMIGGSYVGATQMLAAMAHPPHLSAIAPVAKRIPRMATVASALACPQVLQKIPSNMTRRIRYQPSAVRSVAGATC